MRFIYQIPDGQNLLLNFSNPNPSDKKEADLSATFKPKKDQLTESKVKTLEQKKDEKRELIDNKKIENQ